MERLTETKSGVAKSLPCTWQPEAGCLDCALQSDLMCRYEPRDMLNFLMVILPFAVTAVAGTLVAGYGWYLLGWLGYMLFFFFVWEARVLCSHCPMWAEPGRVLHCHANTGVIKLWKYRPGPMSRWEQAQFIAGALVWAGIPLALMLLGGQYLLAVIGVACFASGAYSLRKTACNRCVNFSCPLNAVPKPVVEAYLRRNPVLRRAWNES